MKKEPQKNETREKDDASISEQDIQQKLYGKSRTPRQKKSSDEDILREKEIQNKLYGTDKQKTDDASAAGKRELFEEKAVIAPPIQEEINNLKQAITSLEEKLKKAENQKERLKIRLVQKRKLINIRERLADLILNRMPEKFLLLVMIIIVAVVFSSLLKSKPKTRLPEKEQKPQAQETLQEETQALLTPQKEKAKPQASGEKLYTIQVAEYADEDAANRFIRNLQELGYEVFVKTILRGPNNDRPYFKIHIGTFDSFAKAKKFNEEFRKKTNINDSFIKEKR